MSLLDWIYSNRKTTAIPGGITKTKISDNLYKTHISEDQKRIWDNERWKRDDVSRLLAKDGFHIMNHGRSGSIYYIEEGKMCEVYFEISGVPNYDITISFDQLQNWSLPQVSSLDPDKKKLIKTELISWLKKESIRNDLS